MRELRGSCSKQCVVWCSVTVKCVVIVTELRHVRHVVNQLQGSSVF